MTNIDINYVNNKIMKHKDKISILLYGAIIIIGVLLLGILRCYTGYDLLQIKINYIPLSLDYFYLDYK